MPNVAHVGDFCPHPACPDYGQFQDTTPSKNIKKAGKTPKGIQRDQSTTCGVTFTETKGTVFYRRRTAPSEIIETLALIAEGSRIRSLSRIKGYKEETSLDWLKAAAHHAEAIEAMLLNGYQLRRGQLDALGSDVGNKGKKKALPKPTPAASCGVQR
ncbi:IS1 family transposase [Candidatus Poribacteria bacterium]|nr:IS1 family transposase [Candidatus Poribacteria bacterium]